MYVCTYECMYKTAYKSPVGFLFQLLAIWLVLYIPSKPPPKMCPGVVVHNFSVQLQAGGVYQVSGIRYSYFTWGTVSQWLL